ncbi:unnamed protein product, partial [Prorocentrum cordatum]
SSAVAARAARPAASAWPASQLAARPQMADVPPELEEEAEVVRAIYGEDAVRASAGGAGLLSLEVDLQPRVEQGAALVSVCLRVDLPEGYPSAARPRVALERSRGLSDAGAASLLRAAERAAEEHGCQEFGCVSQLLAEVSEALDLANDACEETRVAVQHLPHALRPLGPGRPRPVRPQLQGLMPGALGGAEGRGGRGPGGRGDQQRAGGAGGAAPRGGGVCRAGAERRLRGGAPAGARRRPPAARGGADASCRRSPPLAAARR